VSEHRLKQKCFQFSTKWVCRPQQLQVCRQSVPCTWCGNRESSVADSSTCPRYNEVAAGRGAECRSCGYIGDWCQHAQDVLRRVSKKRLVIKHSLYWILSATGNQCNSWSAGAESHGRAACDPEQYVPQRAGLAETVPVWKLEDQPAQRYSSPVARRQVLWLVLLWHRAPAVYGRHVFGADGRNTSAPHVKRASASTARRRTMIRLDLGWRSLAWWHTGWCGRYCSVMAADATATQDRTTAALCYVFVI